MTYQKTENILSADNSAQVKKRKSQEKHIGTYICFAIVFILIFIPLCVMMITSLTTEAEAQMASFHWIPKNGLTLSAYITAFTKDIAGPNLLVAFWNSLWIYIPSVAVGIFIGAFAAYAFAKLEFRAKKPLFALLISGLTLPNCMGTMASFLLFDIIGWVGTPLPLIVPRMLGTVGTVFFLRQFYMGVPDDLMGAGRVDGLGEFGVFFYIMLPISIPALLSQFILVFISAYNDYLGPLLYLQNANYYTLTIAISFFTDAYVQNWPLRMAGAAIATMPLLLLYLLSQKFILAGVAISSGLKG